MEFWIPYEGGLPRASETVTLYDETTFTANPFARRIGLRRWWIFGGLISAGGNILGEFSLDKGESWTQFSSSMIVGGSAPHSLYVFIDDFPLVRILWSNGMVDQTQFDIWSKLTDLNPSTSRSIP